MSSSPAGGGSGRQRRDREPGLGPQDRWAASSTVFLRHAEGNAGEDVAFNKEVSDLVGPVRVARTSWNLGRHGGRTASGEDIPIITADEVRQIPARQALVVAENAKPMIARLTRCIDGKPGRALLAQQKAARDAITTRRSVEVSPQARAIEAVAEARRLALVKDQRS